MSNTDERGWIAARWSMDMAGEKAGPWFPFYATDWLASNSATVMDADEQGAYVRLLCHQWLDDDGCLPSDPDELSKLAGVPADRLFRVLKKFKKHQRFETKIFNSRLMKEWKRVKDVRRQKAKAGKASGLARVNGGRTHVQFCSNKTRTKSNQSESQSQSHIDTDPDTDTDTDGRPVFSRVGIATLKSLKSLREWFDWALTLDDPVVEDTPKCWERVVALAERAVARGSKPQALFANLVGGAQWHQARGKYLDNARKRIAEANGHGE